MKAENITLNDGSEWEVIKERGEVLPDVGVTILSKTLIIKSINLSDLLALVISSQDGDSVWVSNLAGDEEGNGLY